MITPILSAGTPVQYKSCATPVYATIVSVNTGYRPCCLYKTLLHFLGAFHAPGSYKVSGSSSTGSLSHERKDLMETSHFKADHSRISYSLRLVWSYVFVFVSICCRRKLLWWWQDIYEYSRLPLGVIPMLHSFSITVVFGFPLAPWLILSVVFVQSSVQDKLHLTE